jgi:hypothetical protein
VWPVGHGLAQLEQWLGSVNRFTQTPAQFVSPLLQMKAHVPSRHVVVALACVGHVLGHVPQCAVSVLRLVSQPLA